MRIADTHNEPACLERTNLMLSRAVNLWVDGQVTAIGRETGVRLSRSGLIRGVVEGFAAAGVRFRRCRTEEEVAVALESYFRGAQHRKAE